MNQLSAISSQLFTYTMTDNNEPLTQTTFDQALSFLSAHDPDLKGVLSTIGPPPMWAREPGFPTLVHIILEQQVSLASARAAYDRLLQVVKVLTPSEFLKLDAKTLKKAGFSRQKTRYCRILAQAVADGSFQPELLADMNDTSARNELVKLTGIGRWTADIYLLMALRRPDIWPSGDLALCAAVQRVKRLAARPDSEELEALSECWKPWRAVAARIFWHFYLSGVS
ncbi:DNA-3-methyladenine glycosylase family protein [Candidatus Latescibacterota bacterium]